MIELTLYLLILVANGSPIIARHIFANRFNLPVDGGRLLGDGQPLFGHSKTLRGIVASLLLTTISALLLGLSWKIGLIVSAVAMMGDLFSSFIKRRLKRPVSSQFIGLDQIPESLFPVLACKTYLVLSNASILLIVLMFVVGELLLSRIMYKLKIRRNPY